MASKDAAWQGRVFASTKAALGYAVAVQTTAAGPASRRDSAPGPAPDPWLAASVFACVRRAGLDPHNPECSVLRGVLAWATHADGATEDEASRVGSAIRRITDELVAAGIVDHSRPTLERIGWRPVLVNGKPRIVSTTHLDAEGVAMDREQLRRDLEAGRVAPLEQVETSPDPDLLRREDIDTLRPMLASGLLDLEGLDRALADLWGCSTRTARRHRTRLGLRGQPFGGQA